MANIFLTALLIFGNMVLFDFSKDSDTDNWAIVDDDVMGGRSDGYFELNQDGHAVFYGRVSLENNGGFSSVRYSFDQKKIDGYFKILLKIKGDGKKYQFRIKPNKNDRHSYIYYFETSGERETISIPMSKMEPVFRGQKLDMPNFSSEVLEELAFLISNKKDENFNLEIDKITLE